MAKKTIGFNEKEIERKTDSVVKDIISKPVAEEKTTENAPAVAEEIKTEDKNLTPEQELELIKQELERLKKSKEIKAREKSEIKDRRINVMTYPSVYKAFKDKCKKRGIKSVNDCINQLMLNYINDDEM